jgi:hypothetical protein
MTERHRLLFLPVSAARGTGEYARALAVAQAVQSRWPDAAIRFMVSVEAPYAKSVPFQTEFLRRSPTLEPDRVAQHIRKFRPHVIVFDNAGRTQLLEAAREVGARCVFVSSRARQRGKAFRWRWMRLLDEHWIAYPAVIAGQLTRLERFKLGLLKRPTPRFLDVLIPPSDPAQTQAVLGRYSLEPQGYVLVAPGGGTAHRSVQHAPEKIAAAALEIARHGYSTLLVGVPLPNDDEERPATLQRTDLMPMSDLMVLIREARLVVTNGADTLLQVLALRKPAIAVSLSPDQTERLRRLAAAGVDVEVPLEAGRIAGQALRLLEDPAALAARGALAQRLELREGLNVATEAIGNLLPA